MLFMFDCFRFLVLFGAVVRLKVGWKNRLPRDMHGCPAYAALAAVASLWGITPAVPNSPL